MRSATRHRWAIAVATLGTVAPLLVASASPAGASLPAGQVAVAAGGADVTAVVMGQILADLDNKTLTVGGSPRIVRTFEIPAFPTAPVAVPGDASCGDVNWGVDPLAPTASPPTKGVAPLSAAAGVNYLAAESAGTGPGSATGTDAGCIDIARQSGGPRAAGAGDRSTFEYYAFALDAVSWATTSLKGPATLTRQQLTDIYDCNITNWDQVGGTSGPIQRYFTQAGSGTGSVFNTTLLVGKTSSYLPPTKAQNSSCPTDPRFIEQSQGQSISPGDIDKAILPYSAGVWSYQAQNSINPTLDRRNGARLGGITTGATPPVKDSAVAWNGIDRQYQLNTATAVVESNVKQFNPSFDGTTGFPGVRYVYNVLDNNGNRPGYQAAFGLVGFQNSAGGAKSFLCDATPAGTGANEFALLLSNGFAPLSPTANATNNLAGSTCRFFAGVT